MNPIHYEERQNIKSIAGFINYVNCQEEVGITKHSDHTSPDPVTVCFVYSIHQKCVSFLCFGLLLNKCQVLIVL